MLTPAGRTVGSWERWRKVGATCLRPVESSFGVGDRDRAAEKAPEGMRDRQADTYIHTQSVHLMMIQQLMAFKIVATGSFKVIRHQNSKQNRLAGTAGRKKIEATYLFQTASDCDRPVNRIIPDTHCPRRRDAAVELSRVGVGGVYWAFVLVMAARQIWWTQTIIKRYCRFYVAAKATYIRLLFGKMGVFRP